MSDIKSTSDQAVTSGAQTNQKPANPPAKAPDVPAKAPVAKPLSDVAGAPKP